LGRKKTSWNIARERLRSGHNIGSGLLAPSIVRAAPRVLDRRARPSERFQKGKVIDSAMAERAALLVDRKANESLILRLKIHAKKPGLLWQAE
jgi:hypothetical protein